ncbi:hypothetical protein Trydic_g21313 [Trypoxylus dichotomus]
MYTCGPTVYDSAHIGHASCYVKLDIIQRIIKDYFKLNLVTVMNITDIDDKIINESKNLNKSPIEVARYYEKEYIEDLDRLVVSRPDVLVRVTDNMVLIVKFIKKLFEEKFAYKGGDGSIYFDVSQCKTYGKLQNIGKNEAEASDFKKSPADFALWKAAKAHEPYWDSLFGPGRPGWHIECSALAGNIIGSSIDIHAGGIDLRFPHHENEEIQSCAYFAKSQWVNYWLHTGHLHLKDSVKMSKSLKNTISIQQMLQTTSPTIFRMSCLLSHYRSNIEYSQDLIVAAEKVLLNVKNFVDDCNSFLKGQLQSTIDNQLLLKTLEGTIKRVNCALKDDFNTPAVIETLHNLMTVTNKMLHTPATNANYLHHTVYVKATMNYVLDIFNMFGVDIVPKEINIKDISDYSDIVDVLIKFRQSVRQLGISEKNESILKLCDEVRDELKNIGVYIKDHGKVSSWSR